MYWTFTPLLTDAHHVHGRTPIADETDRSKKSLIPVTTTEQRIRFNEVQLKPKSPKPPSVPVIQEKPGLPVDTPNSTSNIMVDRITGKLVPEPSRAAKGKGKAKKKKGKQKASVTEVEKDADVEDEMQGVSEKDVALAEHDEKRDAHRDHHAEHRSVLALTHCSSDQ